MHGADLENRRREPGRRGNPVRLRDALGRLRDEEHVDVTDVVELLTPALAHGDDGQVGLLSRALVLRASHRQSGLQHRIGRLRQAGGDLGHPELPGEVSCGECHDATAVRDAQRVTPLDPCQVRDR